MGSRDSGFIRARDRQSLRSAADISGFECAKADAAAQYAIAREDKGLEAYLDGLGFAIAARREANSAFPSLRKSDKEAAAALEKALELLQRAYPGIKRPAKAAVSESDLLSAASRARLAVSRYR